MTKGYFIGLVKCVVGKITYRLTLIYRILLSVIANNCLIMKKYKLRKVTSEKIRSAVGTIINNGGKVYTDNTFRIMGVKGYFELNDDVLIITIYDKPFFASWKSIENELNDFFA